MAAILEAWTVIAGLRWGYFLSTSVVLTLDVAYTLYLFGRGLLRVWL